jgi:predicted nuclease with TOPRIM domain
MSIEVSIKGVVDFLKKNDDLIREVAKTGREAVERIKELADKLDKAREETRDLLEKVTRIEFSVSKFLKTREKQRILLEEIQDIGRRIRRFEAYPDITAHLYTDLSALYMSLANTYTQSIRRMVTFTDQETDEIKVLLRRSVLDAASRQRKADVLDAAVQLAKLMFKVARKLV